MGSIIHENQQGYAECRIEQAGGTLISVPQLFCEQWSGALGFELAGAPVESRPRLPRRQSSGLRSYMISERAHIATFG